MERSNIKIAIISSFPPRQCGLATFSNSLIEVFEDYVENQIKVIAVNDSKYAYPPRVISQIEQNNRESYVKAANFINSSNFEVVVLQHEYGIYGGENGEFILDFLRFINKPIVTSLHTVLKNHDPHRYKTTKQILDLSNKIIVMTKTAKDILIETMKLSPEKISVIKHGVPNVRFDKKEKNKKLLGLKDKIVISTFGLLGPGKGIDVAIRAMQKITKEFPNVLYLIIGATHPSVLKAEGEIYRSKLVQLVKDFKIENNVKFINHYLDYRDLVLYLTATDVYLSTNLDLSQAFSGTISYALGCGCAVIAGPTVYAKEILANGRGIITGLTPENIESQVTKLLSTDKNLEKLKLKAYRFGRKMIWPLVGLQYLQVVESNLFSKNEAWRLKLPNFNLMPPIKHFERITSKYGIYQHTDRNNIHTKFGYSLDDQVRALILTLNLSKNYGYKNAELYLKTFLSFMKRAAETDAIHNFYNMRGNHIDECASDDCVARSFWAIANLKSAKNISPKILKDANTIVSTLEKKLQFNFVRPMAYALMGYEKLKNVKMTKSLADKIVTNFETNATQEWFWFENILAWGNAIPILALYKAHQLIGRENYLTVANKALDFLEKNYIKTGYPSPVGQKEWHKNGGERSDYDQQPIEAADMTILYNELFRMTKDKKYLEKAIFWFGWFYGNNTKNMMVFNPLTEGIHDGLTASGLNENQGAESTIKYLLAYNSFIDSI